jgi:hypothetical protein
MKTNSILKINFRLLTLALMTVLMAAGCSSKKNYVKSNDLVELKMPFSKATYPDSEFYFHSIQSTKASGVKEFIVDANRVAANSDLAGRISSMIDSDIKTSGSVELGGGSSSGITTIRKEQIIKAATNKVKVIEEKWFTAGTDAAGKTIYEYWAVYRVAIADVKGMY